MSGHPRVGLALGGGGARGLAHIAMLEAFDELGLTPAVIAGSSMGAVIGAIYASGVPARDLRAHAEAVLANRVELTRRIFQRRQGSVLDLLDFRLFGHVLVSGLALVDLMMPDGVAGKIDETAIPLKVIATDFYARSELILMAGPLRPAVAASIALPGFIAAPLIAGRLVVDGAISDPVPFEHVREGCDLTVAVDVTGGPVQRGEREPFNTDLMFGASQILMRHISALMRERNPPDIYIEPEVERFRVLEFFRVREILAAAAPAKEALKRELESRLRKAGKPS
jgi:NTE family protein